MSSSEKSLTTDWDRKIPLSLSTGTNTSDLGALEDAPPKPPTGGAPDKVDAIQKETAANMRHNRGLRETYADRAYKLAEGCISFWVVMLGCQGVVKVVAGVSMWSDNVIIAATTGVTVSVLAAFLGVIRGLFPNGDKK